jgi:hypothetical protein
MFYFLGIPFFPHFLLEYLQNYQEPRQGWFFKTSSTRHTYRLGFAHYPDPLYDFWNTVCCTRDQTVLLGKVKKDLESPMHRLVYFRPPSPAAWKNKNMPKTGEHMDKSDPRENPHMGKEFRAWSKLKLNPCLA